MNKIKALFIILGIIALNSCSDWLDVKPVDQNMEKEQYSSEININSVLNGIYRDMGKTTLYGGALTQTTLEFMAHYYCYQLPMIDNDNKAFTEFAQYHYTHTDIKDTKKWLVNIWNDGYKLIFRINNFIDNVTAITDSKVLTEEKKNVLLGEAHALRAFIHFDIFRIFGPMYDSSNPGVESIPYNDKSVAMNHSNKPASDFLDLVLGDLSSALEYLKDDPIFTKGINDDPDKFNQATSEEKFELFMRNHRMNYYAVKLVQARVNLLMQNYTEASRISQEVIDEAVGASETEKKPFYWWKNLSATVSNRNFIFYSEVMFGISNNSMSTNWNTFFEDSKVGSLYVVFGDFLMDELFVDYKGNLGEGGGSHDFKKLHDVRAYQWVEKPDVLKATNESGAVFVSEKFKKGSSAYQEGRLKNINNLQPLIRMSELFFIQAEVALNNNDFVTAANIMNELIKIRGGYESDLIPSDGSSNIDLVKARYMREIYKEFYGEGQAFFYLKRAKISNIYAGHKTGFYTYDDLKEVYVVPLPESETDYNK